MCLNSSKENPMTMKLLEKHFNRQTMENDLFYGITKCSWFENGVYKEGKFHQDMLREVVTN